MDGISFNHATNVSDYINADGSFRLAGGSFKYDGTLFEINGAGKPFSEFKIKLNVVSNFDGTAGDTTIVQDMNGNLTTGRAFFYGGNNYPTSVQVAAAALTRGNFVAGDIWLSRKA